MHGCNGGVAEDYAEMLQRCFPQAFVDKNDAMKFVTHLLPFLLGLVFITSACAQGKPIKNDDDAAARAEDLTTQYHLTPIKLDCLYFDTADEGKDWLVRVRTKQGGECGGEPDVTQTAGKVDAMTVDRLALCILATYIQR